MQNKKEPLITATDLTIAYGPRVIVSHIDFTINRGDIFVIMGGSGSGKSTIMKTLIGLKAPQTGRVLVGKTDLWGVDDATRNKIICALCISEMCVSDLSRILGINQTTCSHQLRLLRAADIVTQRRDGKIIYYSLKNRKIENVLLAGVDFLDL